MHDLIHRWIPFFTLLALLSAILPSARMEARSDVTRVPMALRRSGSANPVAAVPAALDQSGSTHLAHSMQVQPTPTPMIVSASHFDQLPLSFVPNKGQSDASVRFQTQALGGTLFFTPGEVVFALTNPVPRSADVELDHDDERPAPAPPTIVRLRYEGANASPTVRAGQPLPGVANYLLGNDSRAWRTNVPTYAGITYERTALSRHRSPVRRG